MGEEVVQETVDAAIELGDKVKAHVASDPEAVRKLISNSVVVEDFVTVYPNKALNLRFQKHTAKLTEVAAQARGVDEVDPKLQVELDALEVEATELHEAIKASGITLRFIGLGKKAVKRIRSEVFAKYPFPPSGQDDDQVLASERQDAYEEWLIAAHLAEAGYTRDDVAEWRDKFPLMEFGKMWAATQKLSIADDYLNGAFNVDF
jgi:hypothetical protein